MNNRPTALFVTGPAGAGKSFFARRISMLTHQSVIDKDTMTSKIAEQMNMRLGLKSSDRESSDYLNFVRPFEYQVVLNEVKARMGQGKSVIVDAPFLKEVTTEDWMGHMRDTFDMFDYEILFVWMDNAADQTRTRLEKRGLERDQWKLDHWDEYVEDLRNASVRYDEFDFVVTPENLEEHVVTIVDLLVDR